MLLTPQLAPLVFIGFALLASVGCSPSPNNPAVQSKSSSTPAIATPESETARSQSPIAASPTPTPASNPSPIVAASPSPSQPPESSDPTSLVQDFCIQKGQKVENYFETNNFQIYLCYNSSNQIFYYGVDKRNGASITLPASTEEGTGYVAENGEYNYIVTGASLSVYQNGKPIVEEKVIQSLSSQQ
ncbi:hypothetical protein [Oscillatoria sp. FACHB-1406]|uniref:hypothetical protein n=1 Tax=Oscillatoria sp. FACHB-1406 TaxID=2692846 RepID=UPI0016853ED0|nr:hypothetical protein [Oscillatoria sp. FACHB-1406]MBD2576886.1 hypothetical protein [Oscillatoria sp. FACHB-1406]